MKWGLGCVSRTVQYSLDTSYDYVSVCSSVRILTKRVCNRFKQHEEIVVPCWEKVSEMFCLTFVERRHLVCFPLNFFIFLHVLFLQIDCIVFLFLRISLATIIQIYQDYWWQLYYSHSACNGRLSPIVTQLSLLLVASHLHPTSWNKSAL